ncbi:MAG TPA: ABC transporter permease [Fimbriimonadaceae bacterium]|nr:ABC transporter permease [Fimbriimonadaceae bacterium]
MLGELKELWKFREMLVTMVQREMKIRYKNSVVGFFWSLLNPLITVAVMTVVFKYFQSNSTPNLGAYVLAAYLPYMFFQLCLLDSAQSVLNGLDLAKKIYFPREILPLTMIVSNLIHFVLALAVFFVYLLGVYILNPQVPPFQVTTLWLPVLLVVNVALVTGLGLIISALNTFYEDVKYIVSVLLYLLFFLSPIMYFSESVYHSPAAASHPWVYTLYHLNPVATLSTSYRKLLLASQKVTMRGESWDPLPMDWTMFGITAAMSFAILLFGYHLFNRLKWKFVERP